MSIYVDSSALVKRYIAEDKRDEAEAILLSDLVWVTARHTYVEVSLTLHRRLAGPDLAIGREAFNYDWSRTRVVALDDALCRSAAELGAVAESRALDALHLAAADRAGGRSIPIITFDVRLARAARSLGFAVIGA